MTEAITLIDLTALHLTLLLLPGLAGALVALRLGADEWLHLLAVGLLSSATTSYGAFWVYLASPSLGPNFSIGLHAGSGVLSLLLLKRLPRRRLAHLGPLLEPVLLTGLAALFTLSIGFLYGGLDDPLAVAATRFSHELPIDNRIPLIVAEATSSTVRPIPSPLFGDWLSSDRPPLQTALTLAQLPFMGAERQLNYQVLGVLAQSLWLPGMWAFLTAAGVRSKARALALVIPLLSGFGILHSFYVWPKLLPACFVLLVAAFFLTQRFKQSATGVTAGILAGLAGGYSLLAHAGSAFALAAIAAAMLALRRFPSWRCGLAAIAMLTAVQVPWALYQSLVDPPGNRLLKWHLAGAGQIDDRSATAAIVDAYTDTDPGLIADNKLSNFRRLVGEPLPCLREFGRFIRPAPSDDRAAARRLAGGQIRSVVFFHFIPALGLMALGPLALAVGFARHQLAGSEGRTAFASWLTVGLGLILWCVVMFGPNATNIHEGTLVFMLLAFVGSSLAFSAVMPRLAYLIGALQIAANVAVFALPTPSSPAAQTNVDPAVGALAAVALCFLVGVLARSSPPQLEASPTTVRAGPGTLQSTTT